MYVASSAETASTAATAAKVGASHERTPKSSPRIRLVAMSDSDDSESSATCNQPSYLAEDKLMYRFWLRAKRHANSDLAGSLAHGIGNHTVDSGYAQQKCDGGESCD